LHGSAAMRTVGRALHPMTGMVFRFWGNLMRHIGRIYMVDSVNKKHATPRTQRITVMIADW